MHSRTCGSCTSFLAQQLAIKHVHANVLVFLTLFARYSNADGVRLQRMQVSRVMHMRVYTYAEGTVKQN